jgi:hypothetical protein
MGWSWARREREVAEARTAYAPVKGLAGEKGGVT